MRPRTVPVTYFPVPTQHQFAENRARIRGKPYDPGVLTRPGLTDEQRYVGTTHEVVEYIGPERMDIRIRFVDPSEVGLDASRFEASGIVAHACARVQLARVGIEAVTMIHLARETDDGIEQRSRYWIGQDAKLRILGGSLGVDRIGSALGIKRRMAGERVGYEQLLHDQIEFTHLAGFLADLFREFKGR
jgi:hypothetical protein